MDLQYPIGGRKGMQVHGWSRARCLEARVGMHVLRVAEVFQKRLGACDSRLSRRKSGMIGALPSLDHPLTSSKSLLGEERAV